MADILENQLIPKLAEAAQITPRDYLSAIKTICFANGAASDTQVLVLLQTASKYDLNPLMKEIYAFVDKGGRMQVIVGVDGWIKIANRAQSYDGCEFDYQHDKDGKLVAVTCKIYRKDQEHPTVVTEYLSECKRATEPWKSEHRMLRHKAFVQTVRYAFGTAGIADQDEAEHIIEIEAGAKPAIETTARSVEVETVPPAAGATSAEATPPLAEATGTSGDKSEKKRGRPRKVELVRDPLPTAGEAAPAAATTNGTAGTATPSDLQGFVAQHNVPQARVNMALTKAGVERMDQLTPEQSATILEQFTKSYS